ncbi:hypothetical protein WH43_17410, partial [Rheinheimera sp. KL1]|uniref:hypothetical protein n=1 Tax=Rheinheimera sp. KL1 TaxID=1635005 RepID=UPI0006BFDB46
PVSQVTNHVLATFIRQKLALAIVVPEAENRLKRGYVDNTELYEHLGSSLAPCPDISVFGQTISFE